MPFHLFESDDSLRSSSRLSSSSLRLGLDRRSLEVVERKLEKNPPWDDLVGGDTMEEEEELLRRLAGTLGRDTAEESEPDKLEERE